MQALQCIPDHMCAQDTNGSILAANRAMAESCGCSDGAELVGKSASDFFPSDTASTMRALDMQVIETGRPLLDHEHEIVLVDGRRRWIKASRIPLRGGDGTVVGLVCTSRDVTESKESDELLLEQASLLDMIAQSVPVAQISSKIVSVVENHLPGTVAAIQLASLDGRGLENTIAPSVPDEIVAALERQSGSGFAQAAMPAIVDDELAVVLDISTTPAFEHLGIFSSFRLKTLWWVPVFSLDRRRLGTLSIFSDAGAAPSTAQSDVIAMASHMVRAAIERQETEERNKFLASHDALTGVMNRMQFERSLAEALQRAEKQNAKIGLAFFDLDNFKLINDSLGHATGDALLKAVAERAASNIRTGDVVARLGGDEFVIFLHGLWHADGANDSRFQKLRAALSEPVTLNGRTMRVTCSMGVAYYPDHALDGPSLIANADIAMYQAKKLGRDNIQIFDAGMSKSEAGRSSAHSQMRDAISREEFVLHYQPEVNLETKCIFAAESLVRWRHPSRGLLSPDQFISAAEENGLIIPLGGWVLNEACRQNKRWQDQGLPRIVVNVNISARQFQEPNLVAQVATALATSRLEPRYLELELTESLVMQDGAIEKMRELDALGVKLAIDDFGIGYSSLGALKHFPVSRLKIDRSFIRDILDDPKDQAITSAVIAMAERLRMAVIAEGAETAEQVDFLHRLGCHEIQGYYFSPPVSPDRMSDLLGASKHLAGKFETLANAMRVCA